MKLSRSDLKGLIKECLIEILAEGMGGSLTESISNHKPPRTQTQSTYRSSPQQPIKNLRKSRSSIQDELPSDALRNAVLETSHGNSIMADILADTAMTTLPKMLSGQQAPSPVAGSAEAIVANRAPEEMFGENVDRWANLAFNAKPASSGMFTPPPPETLRKLSAAELDAPVSNFKKTT